LHHDRKHNDEFQMPIAAALPLFATGIGGLGLLGWRRKRKVQSASRAASSNGPGSLWHRSLGRWLFAFCDIIATELLFEGVSSGGVWKAPATEVFDGVTKPNLDISRAVKIYYLTACLRI
jgi:hypothetical protein